MSKLNLNQHTILSCRIAAKKIADQIQTFIDQHSTVTVERTLLRLLGIDGVTKFQVPYVNVVVDHILETADLSKGILHYLSYAVHEFKLSPQEIAEKIDQGSLSLSIYMENKKSPYLSDLRPFIDQTLSWINHMKSKRHEWILQKEKKTTPSILRRK
jgi:beta-lysine 5,6-aminomutase alpha subunit